MYHQLFRPLRHSQPLQLADNACRSFGMVVTRVVTNHSCVFQADNQIADSIFYMMIFLRLECYPRGLVRGNKYDKPKSRITPCGRPQSTQRRTTRDLNFGGRFAFAIIDFFAMIYSLHICSGITELP